MSRGPEQQMPVSRKDIKRARIAQERAIREKASQQAISRRRFFKIAVASTAIGAAVVGGGALISEQLREKTLKEKALSFTWKDAKNKEKLTVFVDSLAAEYLKLTNTPRLSKEDLVGPEKVNFYFSRSEFIEALKGIDSPSDTEWGVNNKPSRRVFIDISLLEKYATQYGFEAGSALLTALWHEWLHLDVEERFKGTLINNPHHVINSNSSGISETYKKYRGGMIFSDTDFIFKRWDEVLVETITRRRILEQVGLSNAFGAGNYAPLGTRILVPFTMSSRISIETLYDIYATSDVERQAEILGENLPGVGEPLQKGMRLMGGISLSDSNIIRQVGLNPS